MIPKALTDTSIELFVQSGQLHAITEGKVYRWGEFPERVRMAIYKDLHDNPQALDLLQQLPPEERLRVYARCKFGGFNATPDISTNGDTEHEHWECNCKGCPLSSVFRGVLRVDHGVLTQREIDVIKLVAKGYLGKQIADMLHITTNTLNSHKRSIFHKVGVRSSVELAIWATKFNLI